MNGILDSQLNDPDDIRTNIDRWEECKIEIRSFCSEFGKNKATKRKNEKHKLQSELLELERQLVANPKNEEIQSKYFKIKQKIELHEATKAKGAQVRARAKCVEDGERNAKYFYNLEKARGKKRVITKLCKESGEIITEQNKILEEQVMFYKKII